MHNAIGLRGSLALLLTSFKADKCICLFILFFVKVSIIFYNIAHVLSLVERMFHKVGNQIAEIHKNIKKSARCLFLRTLHLYPYIVPHNQCVCIHAAHKQSVSINGATQSPCINTWCIQIMCVHT